MINEKDIQSIEYYTAKNILNIIKEISFSPKYREYRISYGSNGTRDLIIKTIEEKYNI